jgi:hypothetical protein
MPINAPLEPINFSNVAQFSTFKTLYTPKAFALTDKTANTNKLCISGLRLTIKINTKRNNKTVH